MEGLVIAYSAILHVHLLVLRAFHQKLHNLFVENKTLTTDRVQLN